MGRFILYIDADGKTKVKVSEKVLKEEAERKKKIEEDKKRLKKKNKNERWLNEWIRKRRTKKQERFIEWLRSVVPKDRWNKYGEMVIRRYVSKVNIGDENECWKWLGGIIKSGYGHFSHNKKTVKAHRFLYMLLYGDIFDDKIVMHKCNNRECVNPFHLELGTLTDNMEYMVECGRNKLFVGENSHLSKKTWIEINEIREKEKRGRSIVNLAVEYGLSTKAIVNIVKNKSWFDKGYIPSYTGSDRCESNSHAVRTWKEINEIREKYKRGKEINDLVKEYNCPKTSMYKIISNKSWYDSEYQKWIEVSGNEMIHKKRCESVWTSKHTLEEITEIREKYKNGVSVGEISKEYKIYNASVYKIIINEQWYDSKYQEWLDNFCPYKNKGKRILK